MSLELTMDLKALQLGLAKSQDVVINMLVAVGKKRGRLRVGKPPMECILCMTCCAQLFTSNLQMLRQCR